MAYPHAHDLRREFPRAAHGNGRAVPLRRTHTPVVGRYLKTRSVRSSPEYHARRTGLSIRGQRARADPLRQVHLTHVPGNDRNAHELL